MFSLQSVALPGAKSCLKSLYGTQRRAVTALPVRARKQSEKKDVDTDLAPEVLPADLQKLSKLAKTELQHHLEVRGLDKSGNRVDMASRLLDNLINQESALSTNPPDRVRLEQQLEQPAAGSRRGRRTSRKATASTDPQLDSHAAPGSPQSADSIVAAAATLTADPTTTEQQATSTSCRGRRTSRKATSSSDPLPSPADMVAAAATEVGSSAGTAAEVKPTGRGRRTSRKATSSADPLSAPAEANGDSIPAAATTSTVDSKPSRRGRKTSRKVTSSADPMDLPTALETSAVVADTAGAPAAQQGTAAGSSKRGRRSKTSNADPTGPAGAVEGSADVAPAAKAGRGRRASRKSSVREPEATSAEASPTTPTAAAEAPAAPRARGRRSGSKTASNGPEEAAGASPAAAAAAIDAPAASPAVSRAKLLAQQLVRKEIATHGVGAAAAGAAAAAVEASAGAAAPGSRWTMGEELLGAGSQAQSDDLLMGGDHSMQPVGAQSTFSIDNGSVDEVIAQLTAERASGLDDEPQLRPEAFLNTSSTSASTTAAGPAFVDIAAAADAPPQAYMQSLVEGPATPGVDGALPDDALRAFDHMLLPPSAGAADAAAGWTSTPADAPEVDGQHPSLADCVAAVEEPLAATAEAVEEDEASDDVMAAFDHTSLDVTPAVVGSVTDSDGQHPSLADCVAAVEEPLAATAEAVEEDEASDDVMAAFDHTSLDSAAAAAIASGNQSPSLADIALAVEPSELPTSLTSLTSSLGEDEEPDAALAAFDHMVPEPPRSEVGAVAATAAVQTDEAVSYDQAYLDPLQASPFGASVGSGSMDMADEETQQAPVAAAPAAPAAAPAAGVSHKQQQQAGGQGDFGAMMQQWWASVLQMFEEWQKNLSGGK